MRLLSGLLLSLFAAGVAAQTPAAPSSSLASLVETERAFARTSVAQGRRAAFLAFFADESLFFVPEPASAPQRIRSWPAAGPFNLDWEPHFGDIAAAGDLGYTTGPFVRTSPDAGARVVGTGWYFTIWRLQQDGGWKVLIDAGINSPAAGPLRPVTFSAAPGDGLTPDKTTMPLLVMDRRFCESVATLGLPRAFEAVATGATRVYRDGQAPMMGTTAIASHLDAEPGAARCDPVKEETARSGDLGYTYGKYSVGGSSPQSGYYLRVWKRLAGEWKLAIDLLIRG